MRLESIFKRTFVIFLAVMFAGLFLSVRAFADSGGNVRVNYMVTGIFVEGVENGSYEEGGTIYTDETAFPETNQLILSLNPDEGYEPGDIIIDGGTYKLEGNKLTITKDTDAEAVSVQIGFKQKETGSSQPSAAVAASNTTAHKGSVAAATTVSTYKGTSTPQTGDGNNILLWCILIMAAGAAAYATGQKTKR